MEGRLLGEGMVGHADVLKVGHHGSKTSTIPPFLDAVSPSIAIISAGYENSFGHPTRMFWSGLEARHAAVLRTDLDGLVTVWTDGQRLWLDHDGLARGCGRKATPVAVFSRDLVH